MKLRNKRTGEITSNYDLIAVQGIDIDKGIDRICLQTENGNRYAYPSLADFNEEWEDYEETALDEVIGKLESDFEKYPEEWNNLKDAKQLVEKLKAWKRLKDNGFKFEGWERDYTHYGDFTIAATDQTSCDDDDLALLFGGEE